MAETLPPMTLEQLHAALENPHFRSYVYFGKKTDRGWKVAVRSQEIMPALRVYLVAPSMAGEVRNEYGVPPSHIGMVFGFGTTLKSTLPKSKAEDMFALTDAIIAASA
jgi:hypothetical protein